MRLIAIVTSLIFVAPGLAEAHVATFNTTVTLRASDTNIRRGDTVRFTAKVTSPKKKCFQNRLVILLRNGDRVQAKRTSDNGVAVFTVTPDRTADWKARVKAFVFNARHRHLHKCKGDTSNTIRVKVRGRGNNN
jgi:hypothetical protein